MKGKMVSKFTVIISIVALLVSLLPPMLAIAEDQTVTEDHETYNNNFRVKNTGLIAYWALDEGKGTQAKDAVSGFKDPVDYVFTNAKYKPSSDPLWRDGIKGKALLFDGYSTWITREREKIIDPKDVLTIEAWVAPRSYEWGDLGQLSRNVRLSGNPALCAHPAS